MRQLEFLLDGGFCLPFLFLANSPKIQELLEMLLVPHNYNDYNESLRTHYIMYSSLQGGKRKWKQGYHCTAFQAYYQISMIFIILGCNSTGTLVVNRPNTCATWQFHLHKLGTNISKILGTTKLKFQRTKKTMIPVSTYNCTILLISTI